MTGPTQEQATNKPLDNLTTGGVGIAQNPASSEMNEGSLQSLSDLKAKIQNNISRYEERIKILTNREEELLSEAKSSFGLSSIEELKNLYDKNKSQVATSFSSLEGIMNNIRNIYNSWDQETKDKFTEIPELAANFERIKSSVVVTEN